MINTWPRDNYTGPGGGMYTGRSSRPYRSNQPPKHILLIELQKRGMLTYYEILRRYIT